MPAEPIRSCFLTQHLPKIAYSPIDIVIIPCSHAFPWIPRTSVEADIYHKMRVPVTGSPLTLSHPHSTGEKLPQNSSPKRMPFTLKLNQRVSTRARQIANHYAI